jgi:hypothetical protein
MALTLTRLMLLSDIFKTVFAINSEATRRRYTNLIVKRLFPDHKLDGNLQGT